MNASICSCFPDFASLWPVKSRDGVETIYKPFRAEGFNYSPYRARIEQLGLNPKCVGVALAKKKGFPYPVCVMRETSLDQVAFVAKSLDTDRSLGQIVAKEIDGLYIERLDNFTQSDWAQTGLNQAPREIQNIGVLLLKSLLQEYPIHIRVHVYALGNTGSYYYRLGFRIEEAIDRYLHSSFARAGSSSRKDIGGVSMCLPEEARELWIEEIETNPIGFPLL